MTGCRDLKGGQHIRLKAGWRRQDGKVLPPGPVTSWVWWRGAAGGVDGCSQGCRDSRKRNKAEVGRNGALELWVRSGRCLPDAWGGCSGVGGRGEAGAFTGLELRGQPPRWGSWYVLESQLMKGEGKERETAEQNPGNSGIQCLMGRRVQGGNGGAAAGEVGR